MPQSDPRRDQGPDRKPDPAGKELGEEGLAWLRDDAGRSNVLETSVTARVTLEQRAQLYRVAESLGVKPASYIRARLFGPGVDVHAWRGVHRLALAMVEAAESGDDPVETAQQFLRDFREIALTLFPEPDGGESDA